MTPEERKARRRQINAAYYLKNKDKLRARYWGDGKTRQRFTATEGSSARAERWRDGISAVKDWPEAARQALHLPDACPILGVPIIYMGRHITGNSPQFQLFDPARGVTPGNVRIISALAARQLRGDTRPLPTRSSLK